MRSYEWLAVAFVIEVVPVTAMLGAALSAAFQAPKLLESWLLTAAVLPSPFGIEFAFRLAALLPWTFQPVNRNPPFPGCRVDSSSWRFHLPAWPC